MQLTTAPVAFTGIAASLIDGGQTIHSKFGVPIPIQRDSICRINAQSVEADALRAVSLIVWDEASMCSALIAECVDRFLKDITGNPNTPFGGKCVVFAGDFRQTLPVVPNSEPAQAVRQSLKHSYLWHHVTKLRLTLNMRTLPEEREFADYLLRIGNGEEPTIRGDLVRVPNQCVIPENNSIIDFVYGKGALTREKLDNANRAILTTTNEEAFDINEATLVRMLYRGHNYKSIDEIVVEDDEQDIIPVEVANSLTPNGYPQHSLNLKEGAIVMLIRNLSIKDGLCNGTRLQVVRCGVHSIRATILFGVHSGKCFTFPRVHFHPNNEQMEVKLKRTQFPFRLAFSMTINKSQGQTFDRIGISLRDPVFAHGQLYVAMSRVRAFAHLGLRVCQVNTTHSVQGRIEGNEGIYTRNIVENSIFNND